MSQQQIQRTALQQRRSLVSGFAGKGVAEVHDVRAGMQRCDAYACSLVCAVQITTGQWEKYPRMCVESYVSAATNCAWHACNSCAIPPPCTRSADAAVLLTHPAEEEFQGFKLKGGNRPAANVPGPLPRYGSSAGLHYMLTAAPAKQVRRAWSGCCGFACRCCSCDASQATLQHGHAIL
jgi:hypothetical protein